MQPLDAVTLKALSLEWQKALSGAKVAKVMHPSAYEFLLTFWGGAVRSSHRDMLYIHLGPEAPFAVLTDSRQRHSLTLNTFDKPTALCMGLRKHLCGAVFQEARVLSGERVADFVLENYNELGQRVRLVLSLELMGKHTNMILYDEEQRHMLAVAHGVSESMSRHRELASGLPYAPPPFPNPKRLLSSLSETEFSDLWRRRPAGEEPVAYLNRLIAGWGRYLLDDALRIAQAEEDSGNVAPALYRILLRLENAERLTPTIDGTHRRFSLLITPSAREFREEQGGRLAFDGVNEMAEMYFTSHLRQLRLRRRKERLEALLERRRERLQRRIRELNPDEEHEMAEIEAFQAIGDRILSAYAAGEISRHGPEGKNHVDLYRYETGQPWSVEIDPAVGWVENAQNYYRRAKKAKSRRELRQSMLPALQDALEFIGNLKALAEHADSLGDLDAVESDFDAMGLTLPGGGNEAESKAIAVSASRVKKSRQGRQKTASSLKGRMVENGVPAGVQSLRSSDGWELLLGKSAQANDAIVGKLSRADDIWLHVHQMPGSHVLIRSKEAHIPERTLEEAAMLAAHYSAARHSVNIPVIHTQIRYVRKIPHSYPGHVNYRQEKTLFITPNPALLDTLLKSGSQFLQNT